MKQSNMYLLFFCLLGLLVSSSFGETIRYESTLTSDQEVPPAELSSNTGTARLKYDPDSRKLEWNIEHTVWNANGGHIHGPAEPGETADPFITLEDPEDSPIEGSATLSAEQAENLSKGLLYINIHSPAYPNGDIRGQIIRSKALFLVGLDGRQESPPTRSFGVGNGRLVYDYDTRTLSYTITDNITATAAHIHGPADPGENASVVFTIANPNQMNGQVTLNVTQEEILFSDRFYVNVHSTAFPSGEIRGQIVFQSQDDDSDSDWTTGEIIGLIIGIAALVVILAAIGIFGMRYYRNRKAIKNQQRNFGDPLLDEQVTA